MSSYYVREEDGTSRYTLEDASGFLEIEGQIGAPFIASTTTVFTPTVTGTGVATLTAPFISATTTVFTPTVTYIISAPFIEGRSVVFTAGINAIFAPFIGARATLTTQLAGLNNDLIFTAQRGGTDGNSIQIEYLRVGVSMPLTVEVSGTRITVYLATNSIGSMTSTASQVKTAIEASIPASFLVSVALAAGNDGTGVVEPMNVTSLTGGVGNATGTIVYAPSTFNPSWGPGSGPSSTPSGGGAAVAHAIYQLALCDRFNTQLSDLTTISFEKKGSYRLNRPTVWSFRVPLDRSEVNTVHTDGRPYLVSGYRSLKVRRNGVIVFNGFVWRVDRIGDENMQYANVTCVDPLIWWKSRLVRDETGNFSHPSYSSPITGGTIVRRMVTNSISTASLHLSGAIEPPDGDLGIVLGSFDETIPPAIDLGVALSNWPITMGEMATVLTETGVCDIRIRPVDSGAGYAPGIMGIVDAKNQLGSDLPSVSFDYATGAYNVSRVRHSDDMETLCNKLWYFLGPKLDDQHWQANVTADDPLLPSPQAAIEALIAQSRSALGVFMTNRYYDSYGTESNARQLFRKLWQTEAKYRVKPRELLHVTPGPGATKKPFTDYNLGDTIRINVGAALGMTISGATQRIYGFDVSPDNEGVERMSELLTSADQE